MKIDAHQHFWKYDPVKDAWITDDMKLIQRDFMPEDLDPVLQQYAFDGCVAVQADQSEQETLFLLDLAEQYPFIRGVVGWVDLRAANVHERLEYFSTFPKLKGFRHIVQSEPQDDFLLRKDFCRGISLLHQYQFTYDILVHPRHLKYAFEFVKKVPRSAFCDRSFGEAIYQRPGMGRMEAGHGCYCGAAQCALQNIWLGHGS